MSRHRDIRNMDYSEDYDGYDDVYGHSVDDDYYISPSHRQFMFNREHSRENSKSEYPVEEDIQEEQSELMMEEDISDLDKVRLESCIEQVKVILGPIKMPRHELVKIILENRFDFDKIVDVLVNKEKVSTDIVETKEKDDKSNLNLLNSNVFMTKSSISSKEFNQSNINNSSPGSSFLSKFKINSKDKDVDNELGSNFFSKLKNKANVKDCDLDFGTSLIKSHGNKSNLSDVNFKNILKQNEASKQNENNLSKQFLSKLNIKDKSEANANKNFSALNESKDIQFPTVPTKISLNKGNAGSGNIFQNSRAANMNSLIKKSTETKSNQNSNQEKNFASNFADFLEQYDTKEDSFDNSPIQSNFLSKINNDLRNCKSEIHDSIQGTSQINTFGNLKISEVNSYPLLKNKKYDIDLTSALKNIEIGTNKKIPRSKTNSEVFEMPFIEFTPEHNEDDNLCLFDERKVLKLKKSHLKKKPSDFSKMLCLRYRIRHFKLPHNRFVYRKYPQFDFSYPSPDDKIQAELRKAIDHQV